MLCSENVQFACGFVVKGISFLNETQTADGLNFFYTSELNQAFQCCISLNKEGENQIPYHAKFCENKMNCLAGDSSSNSVNDK